MPTGCPDLNAVEQCWNTSKRELLASVYYPKFSDMCKAVSDYWRNKKFNLSLDKYLYRNVV